VVALHAPAHGEGGPLFHLVHLGVHRAVALLAFDLAHGHVLRVVEVHQVREVVHLVPDQGLFVAGVGVGGGVPAHGLIVLGDFRRAGRGPFRNVLVAVHAHVGAGDAGVAALLGTAVAILAINGEVVLAG